MTITRGAALAANATDEQVADNVVLLLRRTHTTQQKLGTATGISPQTLSRRLAGSQPWMMWEVQAIARFFRVTLDEMTGDLPSKSELSVRHEGLEPPTRCFEGNPKSARSRHLEVVA